MSNRLLVNPGTPHAWEIILKPGVNRIGRSPESDFPINHASISSAHCEILVSDSGVYIRDLGSRNGTFVNHAPIQEVWLQSGQFVQLGAIAAVFEASVVVEPQMPPPSVAAPGAKVELAGFGPPPRVERSKPEIPEVAEVAAPVSPSATTRKIPTLTPAVPTFNKSPVQIITEQRAQARRELVQSFIGALVGGLLGLLVWYVLTRALGSPLGLLAWGVGGLAGFGARIFSRRGNVALAIVATTAALVTIAGGEFFAVRQALDAEAGRQAVKAHRQQVEYTVAALKVNEPDGARLFLADRLGKSASEITASEIEEFLQKTQPALREFANGRPSKEEFIADAKAEALQGSSAKAFLFHSRDGYFMLIWVGLGLATAFKLASDDKAPAS